MRFFLPWLMVFAGLGALFGAYAFWLIGHGHPIAGAIDALLIPCNSYMCSRVCQDWAAEIRENAERKRKP